MYYQGKGGEENFEKARYWFEEAAKQGMPEAQHNLAVMLYIGQGGEREFRKARSWLKAAGGQGYADAIDMLKRRFYEEL